MSEKKSQTKAVIPAGLVGLFGLASVSMGQTYIGATATNGWNATADVTAIASQWHDEPALANTFGPTNTIDGGGLDPSGLNTCCNFPYNANAGGSSLWLAGAISAPVVSPSGLTGSAWIEYSFNQSYNLGGLYVWNANQVNTGPYNYQSLQDCTVQISNNGINWTTIFTGAIPETPESGQAHEFVGGNNYAVAPVSSIINAGLTPTTYVLITAATSNFNWDTTGAGTIGGADSILALDSVEFATSAVPEPASIGLLAAGAIGLMARRHRAKA